MRKVRYFLLGLLPLVLGTALTSPAVAALRVEGHSTAFGFAILGGRIEQSFVKWIDVRGERTEYKLRWWDFDHKEATDSTWTEISRPDLRLTWVVHTTTASYIERSAVVQASLDSAMRAITPNRAAWNLVSESLDSLAGFETAHYEATTSFAGKEAPLDSSVRLDVWVATRPPAPPLLMRSSSWPVALSGTAGMGALPGHGIALRLTVSFRGEDLKSKDPTLSEAQLDSIAGDPGLPLGRMDPRKGIVPIANTEISSIREVDTPPGMLELPTGLRKEVDPALETLEIMRQARAYSSAKGQHGPRAHTRHP